RVGNEQGGEAKAVRSGFITATIDGVDDKRNVMLVTLPVTAEKDDNGGNEGGKLRLWLTDNTHIVDIGPVSGKGDDVAASSLLYNSGTNNEDKLIALYEKKKGNGGTSLGMVSVLLTEQLQRVKDVLATWKKVDGIVSKLCPSNAEKGAPTTNECSAGNITAGLVGFLSGNFSDNTWMDEYLGVNATVHNDEAMKKTTKTSDGVTFTGPGAGAEWPVGKQGENQLYHFANYNFTLVATVSIDGDPKEGSPVHLMGVKINDTDDTGNTVLLGLSYNSEKKWSLLCDGVPKDISSTLKPETTHHVAIVLRNGTQGSAYVNGQPVVDEKCELKTTGLKDKKVSHFYIGGDGSNTGIQEGVSVTVKNVLLYNRPLDEAEITALNAKLSISKPTVVTTLPGVTSSQKLTEPVVQETVSPNIIDGHQQTATKSLKTSKDAGIGAVSASAVSTVTTPLGEKDSVNPLAPRT
ncbi:trans-sialidase, putative, partial [Trypanosoma cruzi marinkellei]